ncbi:uncharacterized protein METZ01_LOCUS57293, partial [marine metagenome]
VLWTPPAVFMLVASVADAVSMTSTAPGADTMAT